MNRIFNLLLIVFVGHFGVFADNDYHTQYQRPISIQQSESELVILTTEASRLVQVSHEQIQEPERPIPISDSGQSILLSEEEIERIEEERIRNVVKLTATDQLNSEIITNRTRAYLSCESGEMIVKINFTAPFRGVVYANYDRESNCKFFGDGGQYYEMRIPLTGCGTKQEAPRLFINNIIFRFHKTLELEEDEIKTIICRYPPPLAPPPVDAPPHLEEPVAPVPIIVPPKLSEIELLLIICALLFLTLLLLGIGVAYYCLKRRNIKIIRKKKLPTPPPSDITKVTVSSMIEPIRIPRVMSPPTESETDYPSESPSDDDGRRTVVSETSTIRNDHYRLESSAFLPEPYPRDIEREDSVSSFPVPALYRPEITKQNFTTTILETENLTEEDEYNTRHRVITAKHYRRIPPPPSYSDAPSLRGSIPDNDDWSHSEISDRLAVRQYVPQHLPPIRVKNMDDTYIHRSSDTDTREDIENNRLSVVPAPKIVVKKIDDLFVTNIEETVTTESIMKQKSAKNLALPTTTNNATSTSIAIDTSSAKKYSSSSIPPPPPPPPPPPASNYSAHTAVGSGLTSKNLQSLITNVDIKNLDEEKYSSEHLLSTSKVREVERERERSRLGRYRAEQQQQEERFHLQESDLMTSEMSTIEKQNKFNVIFKILEKPPSVPGVDLLTSSVKNKWRTTLITDEVFRSLVIESTSVEEYIRISRDIRYEKLFEPRTWETLIKILTHSEVIKLIESDEEVRQRTIRSTRYGDGVSRRSSQSGIDYDLRSITEEDVNFTALRREPSYKDVNLGIKYDMSRYASQDVQAGGSYERGISYSAYGDQMTSSSNAANMRTTEYNYSQPSSTMYEQQSQERFFSNSEAQSVQPQISHHQQQYQQQSHQHHGYLSSNYQRSSREQQGYSAGQRSTHDRASTVGDREEINSITETDVYDHWMNRSSK